VPWVIAAVSLFILAGVALSQIAGGGVWQAAGGAPSLVMVWLILAWSPRTYVFARGRIRTGWAWADGWWGISAQDIVAWHRTEWCGLPALSLTLRKHRRLLLCYPAALAGTDQERAVLDWLSGV
jgi:hypothetical protein